MKFLILLLLVSCGNGKIIPKEGSYNDLQRYEDKQNNVICYSIIGYSSGGLSCIQLKKG